MASAKWRGPGQGQMEQLYRVRCIDCRASHDIRARDGVLGVELAVRWAREAHWSMGADSYWRCPVCAAGRRKPAKESKG